MRGLSAARPVMPTDVLSLVSYGARDHPNQAWTRERLGGRDASLQALGLSLDPLAASLRYRGVWISAHGRHLDGLLATRPRGSRQAWEIDLLLDTSPDGAAVADLAEAAAEHVGRASGEKLFLRLAADSPCLPAALDCGFLAYQQERLYARVGMRPGEVDRGLRPWVAPDSYPAFSLYSATTLEAVRRCEAATYREWHAAQERRWLRHGVSLVAEGEGGLDALVRAARLPQGVAVDVSATTDACVRVDAMIRSAIQAVGGANLPVFVLTPVGSEAAPRLEEAGFDAQGEYVSLMRRTTRPVALPRVVPGIAKTVVGV